MFDYTNREARRNDLNIYRDVTDQSGPAMTWAMFSIGYRETGDEDQQRETFEQSYKPYVREPFKVGLYKTFHAWYNIISKNKANNAIKTKRG